MAHCLFGADYGFVANVAREYVSYGNCPNPPWREVGPVRPWADFAPRVFGNGPYGVTIISEKCKIVAASLIELTP